MKGAPGRSAGRFALTVGAWEMHARMRIPRLMEAPTPHRPHAPHTAADGRPDPIAAELALVQADPSYRARFRAALDAEIDRRTELRTAEREAFVDAVEAAAGVLSTAIAPLSGRSTA